MNLIKSIFIFIAPAWLVVVVVLGVSGLLKSYGLLFNIGIIASALPLILFFSYIMLFKKLARTSEYLLIVLIPSFIGYIMVFSIFMTGSEYQRLVGMIFSLSAFLITFLYVFWYSNNRRVIVDTLANNQQLPEFMVKDADGNKVSSNTFKNKKSLIFFYRGNWCPLCMAQIKEVANSYQQLAQQGTKIILISPQPHSNSKSLANKFDVPFLFLVDKNSQVAKQLGILAENGLPFGMQLLGYDSDTVMPTVIITDKKNKIIFADLTDNYRVRPEPETFIKILQQNKA